MDLSWLAAKQKRIKDWAEFLNVNGVPPQLKERISNALQLYGKILSDCWQAGACTNDSDVKLRDLERELEMYNEALRVTATRTLSREFED